MNMDRLYLLSYLLTANHALAEKCFVQGLQEARNGNRVFKEWAESWSRRTIILNAIRELRPGQPGSAPDVSNPVFDAGFAPASPQIRALLGLSTFERFVFVVTVLEGYSDRECALLFGCTRNAVVSARVRALQTIGQSESLQEQLRAIEDDNALRADRTLHTCPESLALSA